MIVKVQIALAGNMPEPWCIVYDENRVMLYHGPFGGDVEQRMAGRPKAFFEAGLDGDSLVIGDEAPWQDW
jgi:hypothetical protein